MKFAMISFASTIAVASAGCTYNPGSEYAITGLEAGKSIHVMDIPVGVRDVTIRLAAPMDLDINLYTATDTNNAFMTYSDGHTFTSPKTTPGGTSVQLCADGCSAHARIPRTGSFPNGAVLNIDVTGQSGDELMYIEEVTTEDLVLKVRSYALCDGVITVAWRGSAGCTEQQRGSWLGEVTEDMQTLLPDTVVVEAQEEAVAAVAEAQVADAQEEAVAAVAEAQVEAIATAEPTFECIHAECNKWSCDEWCACWDESYDYDQHGCADEDDDTPCDCGHWEPVVAPVAVPTTTIAAQEPVVAPVAVPTTTIATTTTIAGCAFCKEYAFMRDDTEAQHKQDNDGKCWSTNEPGSSNGLRLCNACADTPGWADFSSYECSDYAQNNWCANGEMVDQRYAGDGAEENCCVCGKNTGAAASSQPCPSMPNVITNTQCDNMVADAAATAATCEASCCDSTCQTWLFKEGAGCYHSGDSCTVMWQGIGGASGWNGGSALRLIEACECRPCGSAVAHNYGGGSCGVASGTCSATVSGAGCYSSASSGCDCALLTTL